MPGIFVTYVGGPTVLLEYAGLRMLTDPTFDPPGSVRRSRVDPAREDRRAGTFGGCRHPHVDAILLSHHEHPDNLDAAGRVLVGSGIPTLTTPYAAAAARPARCHRPGAVGTAILEAPEGEITVTAVPGLHGPLGSEDDVGPVTGFVLEAPGWPSVYVSGDNASLDLVDEIAARFAPIDVAVLFAGAARVPVDRRAAHPDERRTPSRPPACSERAPSSGCTPRTGSTSARAAPNSKRRSPQAGWPTCWSPPRAANGFR